MRRIGVKFTSGAETCEAWLYLPDSPGPHPCIVAAHGIGAIRQVRLGAYAERFASAGFAMLTFDYRHWGTSEGIPRYLCSIPGQHADIHAAIDYVRALKEIDPNRVVLFGTSFGGGHALVVASQRSDLAAVIAQCAVVDCFATALRSPLRLAARWMIAGLVDQARALVSLSPKYIKLAGKPGEVALMTALDAEESYAAMIDGPSPWRNQIAARMILTMPFYSPISSARKISSPLLMLVCDRDEVCPASSATKAAALAPLGRAVHFDSSHFEIYFGDLFDAATSEILEFLHQTTAAPVVSIADEQSVPTLTPNDATKRMGGI